MSEGEGEGKARQARGAEQCWYCIPGFSLEGNFCIPLAFIVLQKSNSEVCIKVGYHLHPLWPNAFRF